MVAARRARDWGRFVGTGCSWTQNRELLIFCTVTKAGFVLEVAYGITSLFFGIVPNPTCSDAIQMLDRLSGQHIIHLSRSSGQHHDLEPQPVIRSTF